MTYQNIRNRGLSAFEETSRTIWGEMQGVSQQNDQEYINEFYGLNTGEWIDIDKLVNYIKNCQNFNTNAFRYTDFIGSTESSLKFQGLLSTNKYFPDNEIKTRDNVRWSYVDLEGVTTYSKFSVKLNKRKNDFIDVKSTGVQIKLDKSENKLYYILDFYFENTNNHRKYQNNDVNKSFSIDEKYIAIQFKTNELKDFFYLWKSLYGTTSRLGEILSQFIFEIKSDESLSLFYSQLSQEVINVLQQLNLNKETLLNHLLRLKKYDEDSMFKDSSLAIINLLSIVKDTAQIYQWFIEHQHVVLQLYDNMDGSTTFLEQEVSNKILFAQICSGIALQENFNEHKGLERQIFKIDEQHKVVSKPFENYDNATFFLQQAETTTKITDELSFDENLIPVNTGKKKERIYMEAINSGFHLQPLAPVNLEIIENGELISIPVAALFVKALADEQVKKDIYKAVRLGLGAVALIIGVATLGTASGPLAIALGTADVLFSTVDMGVTLYDDELLKSEQGKKFLEVYNKFALGVGIVVAPLALASFFKMGLTLLKTASKNTKEFIRVCMLKVLLEKNIINFEANTVKILTQNKEIVEATKTILNEQKLTRLYEFDCFLISGNTTVNKKTVEEFALIYKGEAIAKGTKADFQKQIKEIGKNIHNEKRLVETLDDLLKQNIFVKYADKFKVKFHHHFDGELIIKNGQLKGAGGHNHSVINKDVKVRKYLTKPLNDMPFDVLISVRYKQGQWIEKQAKSSMFPKNWNINRVKHEIATIYDAMIKEGFELKWTNNKYKHLDSSGRFMIRIEVDNLGNITNAYPL